MQRNGTVGQFLSIGVAALIATFTLLVVATLAMDTPLETTTADTPPTPAVLADAPATPAPAVSTVPIARAGASTAQPPPSPNPAATAQRLSTGIPEPPTAQPVPTGPSPTAQAAEPPTTASSTATEPATEEGDPTVAVPSASAPGGRPAVPPAQSPTAASQPQHNGARTMTGTVGIATTTPVAAPVTTPTTPPTPSGGTNPLPATPTTAAPAVPAPTIATTPTATVPLSSTSLQGILGVELNGDQSRLESVNALSQTRQAKPGYVRRNFLDWGVVEPTRGTYNFTATDQVLAALGATGAKPVVVVQGSPAWARPSAAYTPSGPIVREHLADYAAFWNAIVERYSQAPYNVKHWEIYNEPDNTKAQFEPFLGRFGTTPEDYVTVLKTAYEAIKSADPSATVLFGSLAFDFFDDTQDAGLVPVEQSGGVFRRDFLDRTLALGAGQYFDGLGFHYYPEYDARWAAKKPGYSGIAAKAEAIRDVLRKYHLDKPLYNSEIGYPSGRVPGVNGSERLQARFLVSTFVRAASANLRSVIWYRLLDDTTPDTAKDFFSLHGLLNSTGRAKQAFQAFQTTQRLLDNSSFARKLTTAEVGSDRVEGYLFKGSDGKDLRVLWATVEGSFAVTVPGAGSLSVTRQDDTQQTISGSSVTVTADPIFVVAG